MSQKDKILTHLKERGSITAIDALNLFGCFRLASRVNELRQNGHSITTDMTNGYAIYTLEAKLPTELF